MVVKMLKVCICHSMTAKLNLFFQLLVSMAQRKKLPPQLFYNSGNKCPSPQFLLYKAHSDTSKHLHFSCIKRAFGHEAHRDNIKEPFGCSSTLVLGKITFLDPIVKNHRKDRKTAVQKKVIELGDQENASS